MKSLCFIAILLLCVVCEKETNQIKEDYREPYSGLFNFTTIKSTIVMCYDSSASCIDGWKVFKRDTSYITSIVELSDTNRLKMHFGDDIIGEDDNDSIISQTIYPILLTNGELLFPEYPKGGGYNSFTGFYQGYDTITMNMKYGYFIGGYEKYEVIGIRQE